jgi:hypothetical protein
MPNCTPTTSRRYELGFFKNYMVDMLHEGFCIGPSTSVAGRGFFIPGPNFRYRIHKEFRFNPDPDFIPSWIQVLKSIGSWIRNTARYGTMARHRIPLRLYCTNLNSLGLFSAFQYLKFLVLAKMSFDWSITVFIAIGVIFAFIVYDFVLSRGFHYYMPDLLIVEKLNMPVS